MEILVRLLIGFLGITLYALLSALDRGDHEVGSVWSYFKNQSVKWGISFLILVVLSVYLHFVPTGGNAFESFTGFAVSTELASFATLGYLLSSLTRKFNKKQ